MARGEIERPVRLSVIDRLIDNDPRSKVEGHQSRSASVSQLKEAVRRDLDWLLNTRAIPDSVPEPLTELRDSVYTYGLPDITSLSGDAPDDRKKLVRMIEHAIRLFEPRLMRVKVSESPQVVDKVRQIRFVIQAVLRIDPNPEHVVFDTVLDLTSREYAIRGQ